MYGKSPRSSHTHCERRVWEEGGLQYKWVIFPIIEHVWVSFLIKQSMFSEYEYDLSIDFLSNLSIRIMKLMSLPLFSIFGRHFFDRSTI